MLSATRGALLPVSGGHGDVIEHQRAALTRTTNNNAHKYLAKSQDNLVSREPRLRGAAVAATRRAPAPPGTAPWVPQPLAPGGRAAAQPWGALSTRTCHRQVSVFVQEGGKFDVCEAYPKPDT